MAWMRRIVGVILFLLVIVLCVAFWYRLTQQPRIDGKLSVPGLAGEVSIVRDHEGVPHIYAKSEDDAHFALGFVHAQDRLWQMEINRRIYSGRLAEILGPAALDTDRFLRTLGVRRNAEAEFANVDAPTRVALQRYADGVNAYLAQRKGPLPVEFLLSGAPAPTPWTPVDTLGWVTMMAWDLSGNWTTELARMRLSEKLTKKQIDEFLPPYPGNEGKPDAVLATADYTELYRQLKRTTGELTNVAAMAPEGLLEGKGSNNWVVSGARSVTGKPLLANDPHLGLSAPALWYFAHLSAPGLEVIGATLPGVPFVVLGHTQRVAWGFTNTGPDTQDLYIEEIRDGNAKTPTGWQPLEVYTETIKVKGQPDVALTIRRSRHGPLITDVAHSATEATALVGSARYAIAFQWTALRSDDRTAQAGLKFNHAGNWADFLTAAQEFDSPEQNMVYADVDGNIGFVAPGRVPVRKKENDLMGQAPAPGWDARYDWTGFVPFDQLPQSFNPPEGKVVTANQKVVAEDYVPFITSEWAPPWRARRIDTLLEATPKHTIASFEAIQADQRSVIAVELLPVLLQTAPSNEAAGNALKLLGNWDGTMARDRPEPAIFNAWMRELSRLVYEDELGPQLFKDYWGPRLVFLSNVLHNQDGQGRWCDDIRTPQVETCDEIKTHSLDLALADLQKRLGSDPSKWKWGALHPAVSEHRPFGKVPVLSKIFNLTEAVGGDNTTVDVGSYTISDETGPFVVNHGPSLRAIYDLSNLENSEFIHSTGQSGNRLSPLYASFEDRWASVRYIPMKTDRGVVEEGALGTLVLTP